MFQKWCTENCHPVCVHDSHTIADETLKAAVKFKDIHISCVHSGAWVEREKPSQKNRISIWNKISVRQIFELFRNKKAHFEQNHQISEQLFVK